MHSKQVDVVKTRYKGHDKYQLFQSTAFHHRLCGELSLFLNCLEHQVLSVVEASNKNHG